MQKYNSESVSWSEGATSNGPGSDKDWNIFAFYKLSETWFIHTGHGRSRGRSDGVSSPGLAPQNPDKDNMSESHQPRQNGSGQKYS